MGVEPALVAAWLAGRSFARGLPPPVADRGALRVDTGSEAEIGRWIFLEPGEAVTAFNTAVRRPGHLVKLLVPRAALQSLLGPGWQVDSENCMMTQARRSTATATLAPGYRWVERRAGGVTHLRIVDADGWLAASGHAAEVDGAFVYDRILTAPGHRRRGLGTALMAALGEAKHAADATDILTATVAGRGLYERLGWAVAAPWSTASFVPAG